VGKRRAENLSVGGCCYGYSCRVWSLLGDGSSGVAGGGVNAATYVRHILLTSTRRIISRIGGISAAATCRSGKIWARCRHINICRLNKRYGIAGCAAVLNKLRALFICYRFSLRLSCACSIDAEERERGLLVGDNHRTMIKRV